jgi:hypothetical protein
MRSTCLIKARRLVILCAVVAIALLGPMAPRLSVGQTIRLIGLNNFIQLPKQCGGTENPCWIKRPLPGNNASAEAYYKGILAISSAGVRDTLNQFKSRNGFNSGVGNVQAIYFNEGDLRLGRDMHCRKNGPKVACYVSNYGEAPFLAGPPAGPNPAWPNKQDALTKAIAGPDGSKQPFATVAMEYSPTPQAKWVIVREMDGATADRHPVSDCFGEGNIISPQGIPGVDVDTGIDIEPGDIVTFSATGSIWSGVCHWGTTDPNGFGSPHPNYPLPTVPGYGVIGRVGSGGYFNIGDGSGVPESFQGKSGGRLFLRTNDDRPGNGGGSFAVSVTVDRQNVKFYVYRDQASGEELFLDPALDTEGPKAVPQMCMACHGGRYSSSDNRVKGASFLPFDLLNFEFSSDPSLNRKTQEDKFRELNGLVKLTTPDPLNPVAKIIDWMYLNKVDVAGTAAQNLPAPGWLADPGHRALYQSFVRPYCRSCHVAARPSLEFDSYAQLKAISNLDFLLCGAAQMPHAQVPYEKLKQERFDDFTAEQLRALNLTCVTAPRPVPSPGSPLFELCARVPEHPLCRR